MTVFVKKYNLEGITIYFGDDSIVSNLKVAFDNSKDYVLQSIAGIQLMEILYQLMEKIVSVYKTIDQRRNCK
ncbi:MAG: hypothetical protein IPF75_15350 [Bacteroidetes bacterium]|nr:hypothetical protein [Bacteroidota bacterium]